MLAVCHLSGFRSKFWILLLCLTAFASPHLSWINFDNDLCLRSTMRTMGCCLSYFNIVGAFFFSVIENEVPSGKKGRYYIIVSQYMLGFTLLWCTWRFLLFFPFSVPQCWILWVGRAVVRFNRRGVLMFRFWCQDRPGVSIIHTKSRHLHRDTYRHRSLFRARKMSSTLV